MAEPEPDSLRLDVWLWRARFYKTRSLSAAEISRRGVRISRNGQVRRVSKPAQPVRVGDIVTFGRSVHMRTLEVRALGVRRGPASEAATLYRLITPEQAKVPLSADDR